MAMDVTRTRFLEGLTRVSGAVARFLAGRVRPPGETASETSAPGVFFIDITNAITIKRFFARPFLG